MKGLGHRLVVGVCAGLAGTALETLLSRVEAARRQGPAVYDPPQLAGRIATRYLGLELDPARRQALGSALRWTYGPSWGVGLALLTARRRLSPAWPLWGLALGASVFSFEVLALPATGATPPLRSWSRQELALDAVNTLAFGLVVAATLRLLERRSR